jgi:hypothetical protein
MASGCAKKNPASFHTFTKRSSRSSGVGAPLRVEIRGSPGVFASNPYSGLLMSSLSWRSFTTSNHAFNPLWKDQLK